MIFKPEMAVAIQDGRKTVTRRPLTKEVAVGQLIAVQLGMGQPKISVIRVLSVRDEPLSTVDDDEARREGVEDLEQFKALWVRINKWWNPRVVVRRIEFKEVDRIATVCTCCGGVGATTV